MPAVLAFADRVSASTQFATFALFGAITLVILVEFGGPTRSRVAAYLALAGAGAVGIVLGTWWSRDALLAAGATAVVAFALLLSGVINGYFVAGAPTVLLVFIFAVAIPGPLSAVPARLAGWAVAAAVAIGAHLLLWPSRPDTALRGEAARACLALADLVEATFAPGEQPARHQVQASECSQRGAASVPGYAAPSDRPDRTADRARIAGRRARLVALARGSGRCGEPRGMSA